MKKLFQPKMPDISIIVTCVVICIGYDKSTPKLSSGGREANFSQISRKSIRNGRLSTTSHLRNETPESSIPRLLNFFLAFRLRKSLIRKNLMMRKGGLLWKRR